MRPEARLFSTIALLSVLSLTATAQERPVVAIDAGHGGDQAGVDVEGWLEKDLVLRMAFVVGAEFARAGYDVVYTRTTDRNVPWDERRAIAERAGAGWLFMLHANRDEDPDAHGAEVYYSADHPESVSLAERVGAALRTAGSAVLLEAKPWPFLQSETVRTAMIEVAFMTHPVERRLLDSDAFHHEVGRALVASASAAVRSTP